MTLNTPIYIIANELNIDSKRILLACKKFGINAKGSAKRLNEEELKKIKNYFKSGKNVPEEIVDIKIKDTPTKSKSSKIKKEIKINYFPNRLINKS